MRTKQWQSSSRCRPVDPPSSRKMEAKCSLPSYSIGHLQKPGVSEYSRCLHPRTHHNHTRQETSPGHCPNDPAGHKRRCSTRGGCNEFLPKLQPTSSKSTPPHTFAYPIPIRTRGQRKVLTVATHRYRSRSYLGPRQRSHWSPWGTHGWPVHL